MLKSVCVRKYQQNMKSKYQGVDISEYREKNYHSDLGDRINL
jgi:hypothetical protein